MNTYRRCCLVTGVDQCKIDPRRDCPISIKMDAAEIETSDPFTPFDHEEAPTNGIKKEKLIARMIGCESLGC